MYLSAMPHVHIRSAARLQELDIRSVPGKQADDSTLAICGLPARDSLPHSGQEYTRKV